MVDFKSAYSDKQRVISSTPGESMTKQSFQDECDINKIIARYQKTGVCSHVQRKVAQFGDFTSVSSFSEALNMIDEAKDAFMKVPSQIRKLFDHDAGKFVEFCTDPANADQLVAWGLAQPKPIASGVVPDAVKESVVKTGS